MTNSMTTQPEARAVIVGVDTRKHVHVAVVIDTRGIRLGGQSFVADAGGYRALLTWADTHGRIEAFGIEGTGSYGAGLARAVRHAGHRVAEVNRSDRRLRRAAGKSDTIDAEAAARSVLAGHDLSDHEVPEESPQVRDDLVRPEELAEFQVLVPWCVEQDRWHRICDARCESGGAKT